MATNTSLLARIKKIEGIVGPDMIEIPLNRRKVIQVDDSKWSVCSITFEVEQEAVNFSKKLKKQGLTAYLDEILNQLENYEETNRSFRSP